jgi:hypothetical protein
MFEPVTNVSLPTAPGLQILPILANSNNATVSCAPARTILAIVQSCLVTISLCTWVAAHLNLPGPNCGRFGASLARAWIAVESLLTPELVIACAIEQWLVACKSFQDVKGDPLGACHWLLWLMLYYL